MNMNQNETYRDHYYRWGNFTDRDLRQLIREAEEVEAIRESMRGLSEARAGFPSSDCMADVIKEVESIIQATRGENRRAVMALRDMLDERQSELFNNAEYGNEVLTNAINSVG